MKLVAVTVVKNEADIIEAFVRHTHASVDHHLVLDDHSTDGTRQILAALAREGLPLTVFTGIAHPELGQAGRNHLARLAFTQHAADWVLPLNADEFLVTDSRAALEKQLAAGPTDRAVTVALFNYSPTTADNAQTINPVARIQHHQHGGAGTSRIFIPRVLGLRPAILADRGNHALFDGGTRLEASGLTEVRLARFALRTPQQQVLHVVMGELQRLSRGRSQAGLDTHNRLGFQLLAQDPEAFFATVVQPSERLVHAPLRYLGGELRYGEQVPEIVRSARALLPFLESLARSHGELSDRIVASTANAEPSRSIRVLEPAEVMELPGPNRAAFSGFTPLSGWQKQEGPVPSAFLPVFHWGTAPETVLRVDADRECVALLNAEFLTYAERQVTTVVLNGVELLRFVFTQVNQKETITLPLKLAAGENRLVFRHRAWLHSVTDPRMLAVIFLSVRVQQT